MGGPGSGGRRLGSGRKPATAAAHLLRSTHRRDRHGPRPTALAMVGTMALDSVMVPAAPAALTSGLQAAGAALVRDLWQQFDGWTPGDEALVRAAGELVDGIAAYRQQIDTDGPLMQTATGTRLHPLIRTVVQMRAELRSTLAALRLER